MVFSNVPKLHGLIATLAAVAAFPAACSSDDFEGCEASRTCAPATGGSAGSGAGGESGADTTTGGTSGGGSGTSGSAGADDGGTAGIGGSGDDNERPTVEAFTPTNASTEVERDIEVTAELNEPLDEATVTSSSVTLEGPDGEVAGTVSLDGTVISFVPDKPLYLLGDYTFTLADTIADLAGNTLAESASVEFQVRDGRWSEPTFPFGETVPRIVTQFQRNALGDAVLGMEIWPDKESAYGAVYHRGEDHWTPAAELRNMTNVDYLVTGVGIDSERRAVVAWGGYNAAAGYGWSTYDGDVQWSNTTLGGFATLAVTSRGLATAIVTDASTGAFGTAIQDLSDGSNEPLEPSPLADLQIGPYVVPGLDRTALLYVQTTTGGQEIRLSWRATSDWAPPQTVASAPEIGSLAFDSDEEGNVIVIWRESDQIWSRIYHRVEDEWTGELFVTTTTPNAIILPPDMTAGNAIVAINSFDPDPATWAAIYEADTGWVESSVVRLEDEWTGNAVAVSIDNAGRALAAWRAEFRSRRYIPGEGWQAPLPALDTAVNAYYMWAAGAPDGSVLVVSNDTAGNENRAPWAIRFE